MILFRYYTLSKMDTTGKIDPINLLNVTIHLVKECAHIYDYRIENLVFAPVACALILFFAFLIRRKTRCFGLPPPIEPFRTRNRCATATVFGILAFEVLKIFEALLFSLGHKSDSGVLYDLLARIATVVIIGYIFF